MYVDVADSLALVYGNMEVFVLVMVRIMGFFVIMPFFSGTTTPVRSRLAFAFVTSLLIVVSGHVALDAVVAGIMDYFLIIVSEFVTGFLIGFVVFLFFSIFHMMGQVTDFQIGFAMVSMHDPISQVQSPITGNLYYFAFLSIFVASGGLSIMLLYVMQTFVMIPPGSAFILGNDGLAATFVGMLSIYFELGLRFAMPIISVIIIVDATLGILIKAVPQMNVFVVGLPIKVGIGLLTIRLLVPFWESVMYDIFMDRMSDSFSGIIGRLTGQ